MKLFNTIKSATTLTPEQKEAASKTAKTCKSAASIMAQRIFCTLQKIIYRLLKKIGLERFATPVTVLLVACLALSVLQKVPGAHFVLSFVMGLVGNFILIAIIAIVAYKFFKFAKRCYAEAKENEAAPKSSTDEGSEGNR